MLRKPVLAFVWTTAPIPAYSWAIVCLNSPLSVSSMYCEKGSSESTMPFAADLVRSLIEVFFSST